MARFFPSLVASVLGASLTQKQQKLLYVGTDRDRLPLSADVTSDRPPQLERPQSEHWHFLWFQWFGFILPLLFTFCPVGFCHPTFLAPFNTCGLFKPPCQVPNVQFKPQSRYTAFACFRSKRTDSALCVCRIGVYSKNMGMRLSQISILMS